LCDKHLQTNRSEWGNGNFQIKSICYERVHNTLYHKVKMARPDHAALVTNQYLVDSEMLEQIPSLRQL